MQCAINKVYFCEMKDNFIGKKILVIGQVWPESTSSAAGKRMLQLLACFQRWGMQIYFGSTAKKSEFSDDLSAFGVQEVALWLNDARTDEVLTALQPDVVMYDRFMMEEQFGWRVSEQCPSAMTILDTEDLHFLRYARQEAYKKQSTNYSAYLYSDRTRRELASILRSDMSLLISAAERQLLVETFQIPESLLFVLPFMEETKKAQHGATLKAFEERSDFVFIGNFIHEPNWQTVLYLKKTIWPSLRKQLPQAKLHIYGAYPSEKVFQLHKEQEGFVVHGRAADALEVVADAKVMLAPIVFGAGIKGKFIDAMQAGTPSVTTTLGAESMTQDALWGGCIVDEVTDFVQAAVRLYTDGVLWKEKQEEGQRLLKLLFDRQQWEEVFGNHFVTMYNDLELHRRKNFLGDVFRHHSAQSMKYMGLWIEEKNKPLK